MTESPFFIVGFPRSGTTMLRLMLNSHPRIAVPFESDFIPKFSRRLDAYGDLGSAPNMERLLRDICMNSFVINGNLIPDPRSVLALRPRSYAELVDCIFESFARRHGKVRWGDKDPDNLKDMDLLWQLFPGCKFIHIIRDGRDVVLSLRGLDWGSRNLPRTARRWAQHVTLARHVGNVLGADHYLEVRYENLVRDACGELMRICRFLGEPYDQGMLEYHRDSERWIPDDSLKYHRASVRAPDPMKVQFWRKQMDFADQVIFEQEVGEVLDELGYERSNAKVRLSSGFRNAYYALVARW